MNKKSKMDLSNEKKRLDQFEEIAKNWDKLPEKLQGRMEATVSLMADIFLKSSDDKQAG